MLIDISHHQDDAGPIDWQAAAAVVDGVYEKLTEGISYVDPMWTENYDGAVSIGKPRGAYHFADFGDPVAEANHFADLYLQRSWQLRPVLDAETAGASAAWVRAFRGQFRTRVGALPFRVYSSYSLLTGALAPSGWIDPATDIWAARYNSVLGWTHPQLVLWQNSSAAHVQGFLGTVDTDQFQNGWTPAADYLSIGDAMLDNIPCPAGTNQHVCFGVAGAKNLRLHLGYGETATVHDIIWIDDTNYDVTGGTYDPSGFSSDSKPWAFVSDRPGPLPVPPGATQCSLRFDATAPFHASISSS